MNHSARTALLFAAALLAAPCARAAGAKAAGALSGVPAAAEAADLRAPGAVLVEIEGFADAEGGIPCAGRSYSNAWHYKFYSGGDWLRVNACGGDFLDAAKHFPANIDAEPTRALPATFADSAEILKKLKDAGFFQGPSESFERDMLMRAAYLKEEGARPAGCYWTVSRGKEKAIMDCDGKKQWSAAKPAAAGGAAKAAKTDSAGRYRALAISTVRRKHPKAVMMAVESLVNRDGGAKCISAGDSDGWIFIFNTLDAGHSAVFSACKGKSAVSEGDFTGKYGYIKDYAPMPDDYKDSNEAVLGVPASCTKAHATLLMRLHKFKPGLTPIAGHDFLWTTDCGSSRYYVDADTGR